MRYIVFQFVGEETVYLVPENEDHELKAISELTTPDRLKRIGVFDSEIELDYKSRWFLWKKHNKDNSPIVKAIQRQNRNIDACL